jgi:hypothetical protein
MSFSSRLSAFFSRPAVRRTGVILVALVALYALLGTFALPAYVKHVAMKKATEKLGRQVVIDDVSFNPFKLKGEVKGLHVMEPDGKTEFAGFESLLVDMSSASFYRLAPVAEEVALTRLKVNAIRDGEQHYNFSDIIERLASSPPAKEEDDDLPRFSVNNIRVVDSEVDFDDRPAKGRHKVTAINLAVPLVSDFPKQVHEFVKPSFSANVDGAPFRLEGETKPFEDSLETHLNIDLDALDVPRYLAYVPLDLPLKVQGGKLDAHLGLGFLQRQDNVPVLIVTGKASLREVSVATPEASLLKLARLDVDLDKVDAFAGKVALRSVSLEGPQVAMHRTQEGEIVGFTPVRGGKAAKAPAKKADPPGAAAPGKADPPKSPPEKSEPANAASGNSDSKPASAKAEPAKAQAAKATPLEISLAQLAVKDGSVIWRDDAMAPAMHLTVGKFEVKLPAASGGPPALHATMEPGKPITLKLHGLAVSQGDIKVRLAGVEQDWYQLAQMGVGDVSVDLAAQHVVVTEAKAQDGVLKLRRMRDGAIQLPTPTGSHERLVTQAAGAGWTVEVKRYSAANQAVVFSDEAAPKAAPQQVVLQRLEGENFSTREGTKGTVQAQLGVGKKGSVRVSSSLVPLPLAVAGEVEARAVDLVPVAPYVEQLVNVHVTSGLVSAKGNFEGRQEQAGMRFAFAGGAGVENFATIETTHNEDLLRWKALRLSGLRFEQAPGAPPNLALSEVTLSDFYSRLIVFPDGTLNMQHLLVASPPPVVTPVAPQPAKGAPPASGTPPANGAPATSGAQAKLPPPAKSPGSPPPNIRIDRVALQNGRVNFTDNFIKPNYSANLTDVGGTVTGLSSLTQARGVVDLSAKYDRTAPVSIKGTVNPLSSDLFLDITASCKDVELPTFTAYAQKYAGYGITRGKLSLDVKYHVENRQLQAQNRVFLDQLTFGEKVESPDATKLPVLFAVSLLKNSKGEIDIELPVSGSLDDPQFSVGGIIVKVIVNLLTKAVTAPFALIGAAFGGGGGEELSIVEFEPGRSNITPASEEKLKKLVKALNDRPALKLDIGGRYDPERDPPALKRNVLDRKVKAAKRDELTAQGKVINDVDEIKVEDSEYPKYLKLAYDREKIAKPRNFIGMAKDIPQPEMEKLMLDSIDAGEKEMQALALRRAERVKAYFVERGSVPAERLFIVTPGEPKDKNAPATRVDLALK